MQTPIIPIPRSIPQPVFPGAVKGGILKQFSGSTTLPVGIAPTPVVMPTVKVVEETGESLMLSTSYVWNGTPDQVRRFLELRYTRDQTPIIDINRRDILSEIIGMLANSTPEESQTFEEVLDFLKEATDPSYILWDQPAMDIGKAKVAREIAVQQMEEVGVKGVGKCRYCQSTELVFATRQTRSADEATTVFIRCILCNKQWRQ